jgi:hypothetical protein
MPVYDLSVELVDAQNRPARKRYTSQVLADFPAALTAAAALVDDLAVVTEGDILSYNVSQRVVYTDTVTSGANVDEGATFVVRKADNRSASHKIPMPIAAIRLADGSIDITDTSVTDYFANFYAAGDWTISDEEEVIALLAGKLDR